MTDDGREEVLRRMTEDWEVGSLPLPDQLSYLLTMRDSLAKLRTLGFAVAACTWCSIYLPRTDEAHCPVCECLVSRSGRRRFARPQVFGVPIPDGGLDSVGVAAVQARVREFRLDSMAEQLAALVRPHGPKN